MVVAIIEKVRKGFVVMVAIVLLVVAIIENVRKGFVVLVAIVLLVDDDFLVLQTI